MLYEVIITFASLLLFFSSASKNYRKLLDELKTIPEDIKDIAEELEDESYLNPPSKAEFDKLLTETEPAKPDFDVDQFKLQSTRIENIIGIYEMKKKLGILGPKEDNVTERSLMRQVKKPKVKTQLNNATDRAFALMTQFVYAARSKLQHGQLLRKEYSYVVDYKIGYCFALMTDLRKQQMFLYTTLHYNYRAVALKSWPSQYWKPVRGYDQFDMYSYSDFQSFLQLYEKILRLNVDLLDIGDLTRHLIDIRPKAIEAELEKKEAEEEKKKAEEEKKKAEEEKKKAAG